MQQLSYGEVDLSTPNSIIISVFTEKCFNLETEAHKRPYYRFQKRMVTVAQNFRTLVSS